MTLKIALTWRQSILHHFYSHTHTWAHALVSVYFVDILKRFANFTMYLQCCVIRGGVCDNLIPYVILMVEQ